MTAVISAVGGPAVSGSTSHGVGKTTMTGISPTAIGNLWILKVAIASNTINSTAVTGGGVTTWTKVISTLRLSGQTGTNEVWIGVVTALGSSTITVTASSSVASLDNGYHLREFTCVGVTGNTLWAVETSSTLLNASSTTVTFPSLTPLGLQRAYVGFGYVFNAGQATGQTSGYTLDVMYNSLNHFIFNENVANSVQAPTSVQSPAGTSHAGAFLLTATNPATANFLPFFM